MAGQPHPGRLVVEHGQDVLAVVVGRVDGHLFDLEGLRELPGSRREALIRSLTTTAAGKTLIGVMPATGQALVRIVATARKPLVGVVATTGQRAGSAPDAGREALTRIRRLNGQALVGVDRRSGRQALAGALALIDPCSDRNPVVAHGVFSLCWW